MGFYSSMMFVRQGSPCVVMTSDLLKLVQAFDALGVMRPVLFSVSLKYGSRVDLDHKPTHELVTITPGIAKVVDIKWDIENLRLRDAHGVSALLQPRKRWFRGLVDEPIYRAHLSLGGLPAEVIHQCHPENPPENAEHFHPDSWGLEVGDVTSSHLSDEEERHVGWIALCLRGYGYLYPLTEQQFIERAIGHPVIQSAMNICRDIWPETAKHKWAWHVSETG